MAESLGPDDPLIGKTIGGQFHLLRRLGRGAGSVVYEAHDPSGNRGVAVKMLLAAEIEAGGEVSLGRFVREAQAAARIEHPNVAAVYKVGFHEGIPFMVMQLVRGPAELTGKAAENGLPPLRATYVVRCAARGLAAAHALGVIHRDVKPGNILVGADGEVKVTDFGLARIKDNVAAQLTEPGQTLGTPAFMAPEQCTGGTVDHRSDIYSLGATYFRLLTGRPPFGGTSPTAVMFRQIRDRHPDPRTIRPDVPALCVRIIDRAMEKRPEDRWRSMDEMAEALEAVERSLKRDEEMAAEAEAARAAGGGGIADNEIADLLADDDDEELMSPKPPPARAAAARPSGEVPVPAEAPAGGGAVPATFQFLFAGAASAKTALDYLRADLRAGAGTAIRPARRTGHTLLEVTLNLPPKQWAAAVRPLMAAGGRFHGIDTPDKAAGEAVKRELSGLKSR